MDATTAETTAEGAAGTESAERARAAALAAVERRLAEVETLGGQLSDAIGSIVDSVVALKTDEVGTLQRRLRELEQQLALERCLRDLDHTSRAHPKTRCVVFVGTIYFGDNVKYAWLGFRARARRDGIACWFLPQNAAQQAIVEGLGEACLPHRWSDWTAEHLHAALSAAAVVTSDHLLNPNPYAGALLAGARHVQLWHGVSIKEIGLRNLPPLAQLSPRMARVLATCGPFAELVGTSAAAESEWRRWFGFERYAPIGYPRNDVLHREPTADDLLNTDSTTLARMRQAGSEGRRVWLWAPTFRDANRGRWLIEAGAGRIAAELQRRRELLVVNLHPVEQAQLDELRAALPGVVFVAAETDLYPLLAASSALITDYSSIMFDYLHLQRPIVLFRPDHGDYTTRSRTLFDAKLAGRLPGPVVGDAGALLGLLAKAHTGTEAHAQARDVLRAELYDHHDGRSAERLADRLVALLPEPARPGAA